ncbi:MAG: GyrI-like domain-containing protein [Armatimonadota bacterium]
MEPNIVRKDQFMVVGTEYTGKNENGEIPAMWGNEFMPRINEIKNVVNPCTFYGICTCTGDAEAGTFSYIAGREVSSLDDIPARMVGTTIPAYTYAVFTHVGSLDKLGATWMSIYQDWLPASGYEPLNDLSFEYYDERFKDSSEASELDIYVAVKV